MTNSTFTILHGFAVSNPFVSTTVVLLLALVAMTVSYALRRNTNGSAPTEITGNHRWLRCRVRGPLAMFLLVFAALVYAVYLLACR